jgi:hypothetical protein
MLCLTGTGPKFALGKSASKDAQSEAADDRTGHNTDGGTAHALLQSERRIAIEESSLAGASFP